MTIPPLPEHPRFRMRGSIAEFSYLNARDDKNPALKTQYWIPIEGLNSYEFENCCAIAIVWWIAKGSEELCAVDLHQVMAGQMPEPALRALEWRRLMTEAI